MAVTIGSAGITFNNNTVQATAGIILSQSTTAETTDYTIGTTILVSANTDYLINTAFTVYAAPGRAAFILSAPAGALPLVGVWRSRGTVFVDSQSPSKGVSVPYYAILVQRVT
jgi:hypothetical protein